jgi:hypothetical protein
VRCTERLWSERAHWLGPPSPCRRKFVGLLVFDVRLHAPVRWATASRWCVHVPHHCPRKLTWPDIDVPKLIIVHGATCRQLKGHKLAQALIGQETSKRKRNGCEGPTSDCILLTCRARLAWSLLLVGIKLDPCLWALQRTLHLLAHQLATGGCPFFSSAVRTNSVYPRQA